MVKSNKKKTCKGTLKETGEVLWLEKKEPGAWLIIKTNMNQHIKLPGRSTYQQNGAPGFDPPPYQLSPSCPKVITAANSRGHPSSDGTLGFFNQKRLPP